MRYETALAHFERPTAIAKACGVSRQQVNKWRLSGVIPIEHVETLERASGGAITVETSAYSRRELAPAAEP